MIQYFPSSSSFRPLAQSLMSILLSSVLLAVLLAGAFDCLAVNAAGGQPVFGLQPVHYDPSQPTTQSYFVFDAHPGMTLHNQIRVTNSGTATGTANLYTVDATTGQTSGTVYLSHKDIQHDAGAWMTLGTQHVTLAPGQSQIVPFQVIIPSTTWLGQHVGGIVAESASLTSSSGTGSIHINVQSLTIIAVQINLPGPSIEQLTATGIQYGGENKYQDLLVGLNNTGNIMLKSSGTLGIADTRGNLLQNLPLKLDTFLPHTSIKYPVYIKGAALKAGTYQAILTLIYGHGRILRYTTTFTITQQQIKQVYNASPSFQPSGFWDFFNGLSLWEIMLGGLLLLSGLFFWGQKLYRVIVVSRRKLTNG